MEKQLLVFADELLGELFLQVVQRVGRLFHRALGTVAAILRVDVLCSSEESQSIR